MGLEDNVINRFLQLLEQVEDPPDALANVAQIWLSDGTGTGNTGDIYAKIHQGGDPGSNVTFKLLDFLYATFFGIKQTLTAAASVEISAGRNNLAYCLLDQNVAFTIVGGTEGQRLYLVLKEDGTGDWEASFGSGFGTIASILAGANAYMILPLIYDSDNSLWHQIGRNIFVPYTGAAQDVNLGTKNLTTSQLTISKQAIFDTEYDNGNSGSSITIDWTDGNKQRITLTDDCTFTFTSPGGSANLMFQLIQDATGSRSVTWPASVKWSDGIVPILTTDASAIDITSFYFDGSSYFGTFGGDFS